MNSMSRCYGNAPYFEPHTSSFQELLYPMNCSVALPRTLPFDFSKYPVTKRESARLTDCDDSNMTAAVCHKTIYGDISLEKVLSFVSYYRLLGFDRIFLWYEPEMRDGKRTSAQFKQLEALPYVTLTEIKVSEINKTLLHTHNNDKFHGQVCECV
jgi:hypothetical protein